MQHCWFVVGGSGNNTFPISLEATLDHGLQTGCVEGLLNKSDHFNWKNHTEPFSLQRHLPSGWSWGSKDLWGHVSKILVFLSLRHIKLNPNLIKLVSLEQMPYMHYKTNCFNKQKVWNVWFQVGERSQRGPWQDGCYFLCHCVVVATIAIFIVIITRCGTQGRSTRVGGRTTCNRARGNTGETHSENQWGTQGNA